MQLKKISYLNETYHKKKRDKPKEIFTYLIKLLKKKSKRRNISLIDIGCANGELLYHLGKNFPEFNLTGIDVDKDLLNIAKKTCPKNIKFEQMNVLKLKKKIKKYDIIVISGVLSIFEDAEKILNNLLKILKPKGLVYIFESLNLYSYNLQIKATTYKKRKKIIWNKYMYSKDFFNRFANKHKMKCSFFPVRLNINLKKDKKNLQYGWTEYLSNKKIVTSGLGIIQNQFWTKLSK